MFGHLRCKHRLCQVHFFLSYLILSFVVCEGSSEDRLTHRSVEDLHLYDKHGQPQNRPSKQRPVRSGHRGSRNSPPSFAETTVDSQHLSQIKLSGGRDQVRRDQARRASYALRNSELDGVARGTGIAAKSAATGDRRTDQPEAGETESAGKKVKRDIEEFSALEGADGLSNAFVPEELSGAFVPDEPSGAYLSGGPHSTQETPENTLETKRINNEFTFKDDTELIHEFTDPSIYEEIASQLPYESEKIPETSSTSTTPGTMSVINRFQVVKRKIRVGLPGITDFRKEQPSGVKLLSRREPSSHETRTTPGNTSLSTANVKDSLNADTTEFDFTRKSKLSPYKGRRISPTAQVSRNVASFEPPPAAAQKHIAAVKEDSASHGGERVSKVNHIGELIKSYNFSTVQHIRFPKSSSLQKPKVENTREKILSENSIDKKARNPKSEGGTEKRNNHGKLSDKPAVKKLPGRLTPPKRRDSNTASKKRADVKSKRTPENGTYTAQLRRIFDMIQRETSKPKTDETLQKKNIRIFVLNARERFTGEDASRLGRECEVKQKLTNVVVWIIVVLILCLLVAIVCQLVYPGRANRPVPDTAQEPLLEVTETAEEDSPVETEIPEEDRMEANVEKDVERLKEKLSASLLGRFIHYDQIRYLYSSSDHRGLLKVTFNFPS